jgi:thioredoxin 1
LNFKDRRLWAVLAVIMVLSAALLMKVFERRREAVEGLTFEVSARSEIERALSSGLPVMIDFGSEYCGPCRAMESELIWAEALVRGKGIILFADVWKDSSLAEGFPLRVIPTQFFFNRDGTPLAVPKDDQLGLFEYRDGSGRHVYTIHEGPLTSHQILGLFRLMGVDVE